MALELRAHVGNARTRRISTVSLMSSNDEICEKGSKCCDELRAFVRCTTAHLGQAPKEYETEWCTEEKHVVFISRVGALYFLYFLSPFSCLFVCVYVRVCLYCKGQIPSVHAPRLAAETCYPPHAFKTCGAVNARVHECLPDWVHPGVLSPILLRRPANGSSIAMVLPGRKHKKKHKGDTGGGALDG